MKKLLTVAALLTATVSFASCEKTELIDVSQLPSKSRTFLKTHFDGIGVISVVKEVDGIEKDYRVNLENGFTVDFTRSGEWDEVDGHGTVLPDSVLTLLPEGIGNYVKQYYPDKFIVKVSNKERHDYDDGYDIDLDGGIELEFSSTGVLLERDND